MFQTFKTEFAQLLAKIFPLSAQEIENELCTRVYMIIRDDLSIIAYENTKIKIGDIIILRADNLKKSNTYVPYINFSILKTKKMVAKVPPC